MSLSRAPGRPVWPRPGRLARASGRGALRGAPVPARPAAPPGWERYDRRRAERLKKRTTMTDRNTVLLSGTLAGVTQRRVGQKDRTLYEMRL